MMATFEDPVLRWDPDLGFSCPACPRHTVGTEDDRFEVALVGKGLHGGEDHWDVVRLTRRAPGPYSGPFRIPSLAEGVPITPIVDFLERQTFPAEETGRLVQAVTERFPDATAHVWTVRGDVIERVADDAFWDAEEDALIRGPNGELPPTAYPSDVGWRDHPEQVIGRDGRGTSVWRACLYVDPDDPEFVRYGWHGLGGPEAAFQE
jgi:hypothetical protein